MRLQALWLCLTCALLLHAGRSTVQLLRYVLFDCLHVDIEAIAASNRERDFSNERP